MVANMRNAKLRCLIFFTVGTLLSFCGPVIVVGRPATSDGGWLARLQGKLLLPKGGADYLAAYSALVARRVALFSSGAHQPSLRAAQRRVADDKRAVAEIRRIVKDVAVIGVPPSLLRNALLRDTNITLNKAGPYGTVFGRLGITLDIQYLASRKSADGHPRRAAMYLRTAIFLLGQDNFDGLSLLLSGDGPMYAQAKVLGLAKWLRSYHAQHQRAYTAWWAVLERFDRAFTEVMRSGGKGHINALRTHFRSAAVASRGHLHWQLMLASDARDHMAELSGRRMFTAASALRAELSGWLWRTKETSSMQAVERSAVIRWIKEAMGP